MGDPVVERMIQLTARSTRFRSLMHDLFAGSQEYTDLKRRFYRSMPIIAAEALASTLCPSRTTSASAGKTATSSPSRAV